MILLRNMGIFTALLIVILASAAVIVSEKGLALLTPDRWYTLPALDNVESISLHDGYSPFPADTVIHDPATISRVVGLMNKYRDSWFENNQYELFTPFKLTFYDKYGTEIRNVSFGPDGMENELRVKKPTQAQLRSGKGFPGEYVSLYNNVGGSKIGRTFDAYFVTLCNLITDSSARDECKGLRSK